MISKEDYIQGEVSVGRCKFINQVLYSFFEDNVDLNQEEFKEYLIDLGWEVE